MTIEKIAKKARMVVQIRSIIIGLERLKKLLADDYPVEGTKASTFSGELEDLSHKMGWEGRGKF